MGVSEQVDAPRRAMRRGVRPPSARSVLFVFGLAVSLFFGYLAVRDIRPADTWQAFVDTDYVWLVPGTALFGLAFASAPPRRLNLAT